jgi:biotin carboxylase
VSFLARTIDFHRIAPLDDFDVERVARLREHLRIPGMGETTARYFRDKLAMRARARDRGIPHPRFVHLLNRDRVGAWMREVSPPWMLKPRSEASAVGIRKIHDPESVWKAFEELGDRHSYYLLEEVIEGDVYHIDSIVSEREVVFAEAHRYLQAPFDIMHGGGIFRSVTLPREGEEAVALKNINRRLVTELGFVRGVLHTEFIRHAKSGELYFLETGARVGGANIAELIEAATGVNLWEEWAKIEVFGEEIPYEPPAPRTDYGGLIVSLAHQEHPETSGYDDPEIVWRLDKKNHVGFILRSESPQRVSELIESYTHRIRRDFQATLPAPDTPAD